MKMTDQHFQDLNALVETYLGNNPAIVTLYETGLFINRDMVKDLQRRFCFDVLFHSGGGKYACNELYSYLNDDQIYTALKKMCPKVVRKY